MVTRAMVNFEKLEYLSMVVEFWRGRGGEKGHLDMGDVKGGAGGGRYVW